MNALTEKTFNAGLVAINYAEGPASGPPLLLLHGLGNRWQVFLPLTATLAQRWHVFAPDFRGHGKSGRVPGAYRGEEYSADIVAFLQQVVGGPAVIFGHSLGGMVGMWIAAHDPKLVRALILGDNVISLQNLQPSPVAALFVHIRRLLAGGSRVNEFARQLGELPVPLPGKNVTVKVKELPGNDEAYLRWLAVSLLQVDTDAIDMVLNQLATRGWEGDALMQKISCPTLLMQANPALGGLMSDRDVEYFKAANRHAISVRFDALGHTLYMVEPAPVLRVVMNFLESLS